MTQAKPAELSKPEIAASFMVHIGGGCFSMGSNEGDDEVIHDVYVNDFFVGKYEVTFGEFREFLGVTHYRTDTVIMLRSQHPETMKIGFLSISYCDTDTYAVFCGFIFEPEKSGGSYVYNGSKWEQRNDAGWLNPYFNQSHDHPVVCISWNDAIAYCNWRSQNDGLTPVYTFAKNTVTTIIPPVRLAASVFVCRGLFNLHALHCCFFLLKGSGYSNYTLKGIMTNTKASIPY